MNRVQRFAETFSNKVNFIKKWLISNAKYQSFHLSKKDAEDTANYYAAKLDVHSLEYRHNPEVSRHPSYRFKVRVGTPRFRGTVNYTLLPHSLCFNTRSSGVKLAPETEEPSYFRSLVNSVSGPLQNWHTDIYADGNFTGHPHIATDGNPCLGGWAQAWSQTIATNNIVSLIPVAQSFLNTWTANDAFWNINRYYRDYRMIPIWIRKEYPLKDYLADIHIWYTITGNSDSFRRLRSDRFANWCRMNEGTMQELIHRQGISPRKIANLWYGAYVSAISKHDTECGYRNQLRNGMGVLSDIWYNTRSIIEHQITCPDNLSRLLAAEAMVGKPQLYIPAPWSSGPNSGRTVVEEWGRMDEYMSNDISSTIRYRDRADGVHLADLMELSRKMNRGKRYRNTIWLTKADIEQAVGYYINHRAGSTRFTDCLASINNVLSLCNIDYQITRDSDTESYTEDITPKLIEGALQLQSYFFDDAEPERIQAISNTLAYNAICNFEKTILRTTKRIRRGKERLAPVPDKPIGDGAQQSQIPIESF